MFDHPLIQSFAFEDIPLNRDLTLMAETWMMEYESALVKSLNESGDSAYTVGYHAFASARSAGPDWMELTWYPNIIDRFHSVRITLPRSKFITCVGSWQYSYKPVIFVRGDWLNSLYLRSHSVFALIDAINVKKAIITGTLIRPKLIELRDRIDEIAARFPAVAFMSFADSLLLKSNYTIGMYGSHIKNTYEPETILRLLPDIQKIYNDVLGLNIYAVITQGSNEYYDDSLLHISSTHNHISFNSLGLPFAQTQAIEQRARASIKKGMHPAADAYLDENFYYSLRFKFPFEKNKEPKFPYVAPMATGDSFYFPVSFKLLVDHLEL